MITTPNFDAVGFNSLYLALSQEAQDRDAAVRIAKDRIEPKLLISAATGTANNFDLAGASIVYFNGASALDITGFRAPDPGKARVLWIYNASSGNITIKPANAGSATANQIIGPMASTIDYIMPPGGAVQFAYLNQRWRGIGTQDGLWQSFTPTFSGFTLGNGSQFARYTTIGANTFVYATIVLGSTSSWSGTLTIGSLPTNNEQNAASMWMGNVVIYDSSAGQYYQGWAGTGSANAMVLYCDNGSAGGITPGVTSTTPITFATSDQITVNAWWRTV